VLRKPVLVEAIAVGVKSVERRNEMFHKRTPVPAMLIVVARLVACAGPEPTPTAVPIEECSSCLRYL
jgi:hypothetical protein